MKHPNATGRVISTDALFADKARQMTHSEVERERRAHVHDKRRKAKNRRLSMRRTLKSVPAELGWVNGKHRFRDTAMGNAFENMDVEFVSPASIEKQPAKSPKMTADAAQQLRNHCDLLGLDPGDLL